jgi:hypothetical protein
MLTGTEEDAKGAKLGIFEIMEALGKDETLERLQNLPK